MSGKPKDTAQNPEEPYPPGEVERDNDALRPTDPTRREENGKGTQSGESTAQETADQSAVRTARGEGGARRG